MKRFRKPLLAICSLVFVFLACTAENGCEDKSDVKERADVERGQAQLVQNQPAPVFQWSLERHLMIKLYEARNNAVTTYSYVQSPFTGKILFECPSIGFPIPATTQLTNPMKTDHSGQTVAIPQAEPNGLYAPPQSNATFVMCLNADGEITPFREEKDVSVSFQPMEEINGKLVPVPGKKPSLSISTRPEK